MSEPDIQRQRRKLELWLREWEIYHAIPSIAASGSPNETTGRSSPGSQIVGQAVDQGPITPGQIRLLHPLPPTPSFDRPIYLAVLEKQTDGRFLVAPFSRFSTPAVPGELATRLDGIHVRVLCVWNSQTVETSTLSRSWVAGEVPADRIRLALELHRHAGNTSLESEIGPPLLHPLDPRHRYLAEEAESIHEALAAAEALNTTPGNTIYDCSSTELLKAAEGKTTYGKKPRKPRRKKET